MASRASLAQRNSLPVLIATSLMIREKCIRGTSVLVDCCSRRISCSTRVPGRNRRFLRSPEASRGRFLLALRGGDSPDTRRRLVSAGGPCQEGRPGASRWGEPIRCWNILGEDNDGTNWKFFSNFFQKLFYLESIQQKTKKNPNFHYFFFPTIGAIRTARQT